MGATRFEWKPDVGGVRRKPSSAERFAHNFALNFLVSIYRPLEVALVKRAILASLLAFALIGTSYADDSSSSPPIAATPGKMGVTATGAFTYSIPIVVPPGTNNIVPALSFDYSSQYGDSTVGFGWTLAGLPTITRCPRTLAQDGIHGSVN